LPASAALVAYASRRGTTRGIASRISARLRTAGLEVVLRPAAEVRDARADEIAGDLTPRPE
jgi:menaquinone-dependent protoporphyrinogen IX oxidase